MTTLSTRERDRRAQRVFFVVMAVVMAGADVWLHFHAGVIRPSTFWVPTVVGLVYGAVVWPLGLRQESRWWPNMVGAGFLGGFLVLIATKTFSPYAWFLAVVIGKLLFQAALPPKRPGGAGRRQAPPDRGATVDRIGSHGNGRRAPLRQEPDEASRRPHHAGRGHRVPGDGARLVLRR